MPVSFGYVRLSRDDDGKNYASIENQKLIISQKAAEDGRKINRYFEDDGSSGYLFERKGLADLMDELYSLAASKEEVTVYVKDLSRLGRHNARVLLLLEEFGRQGVRLIAIDDMYDSFRDGSEDDIIGIKTWFNERYVKDISKKIKKSIEAKQKAGTLLISARYGYEIKNGKLVIDSEEAENVRLIDRLYIQGNGCRKIADELNSRNIATPSLSRYLRTGKNKQGIVYRWSESMVKGILDDDCYTGTLRTHKRSRVTVHGKEKRVEKANQFVFPKHHAAIRSISDQQLINELREKRSRRAGTKRHSAHALFSGLAYCKDCGRRLTPIRRQTEKGVRKYYICSGYNSKGKAACKYSHIINESVLEEALYSFLRTVLEVYKDELSEHDRTEEAQRREGIINQTEKLMREIQDKKTELEAVVRYKIKMMLENREETSCQIKSISENAEQKLGVSLYLNSCEEIESEIIEQIEELEKKANLRNQNWNGEENKSTYEFLKRIIEEKKLSSSDLEILVDRITVDSKGNAEICFCCGMETEKWKSVCSALHI